MQYAFAVALWWLACLSQTVSGVGVDETKSALDVAPADALANAVREEAAMEADKHASLMDDDDDERSDWRKRRWTELQGVWGKRGWNDLNGVWGKREGNWNNLKGLWGKREGNWNNLKGLWGKRDGNWNNLKGLWGKRDGNWNNLKGLWGKRDGNWNNLKGLWGKRSFDSADELPSDADMYGFEARD